MLGQTAELPPDRLAMSQRPAVVAIGSCRVYEPLRAARDAGHIESLGILFPHIHNPLEIIQALKILAGAPLPPEEIWPLTNVSAGIEKIRARAFGVAAPSDVMVVELSSIRLIEFAGWQLQINTFRERLAAEGVSLKWIKDLYSDPSQAEHARELILQANLSQVVRTVVEGATFSEMTAADVLASLDAIVTLANRPVMFVGHCSVDQNDSVIGQRKLINDVTKEYTVNKDNTEFFDPTRLVQHFGFDTVMQDLGHYRSNFYPRVGMDMADAIVLLVQAEQKRAQRGADNDTV